MNIPFTVEQFLGVFESYNVSVWPMQIIAYLLGAAAIAVTFKRWQRSNQIIAAILSFMWIWNGAVYHIGFFSGINKPAYLFGALFIAQGLAIFYKGALKKNLQFGPKWNTRTIIGAALIIYAMIFYPLFNHLSGHVWPQQPMFGIAPCPTTIFTFGLFLFCSSQFPKSLVIVPLMWSLVGTGAAISLHIAADFGLLIAGILAAGMIVVKRQRTSSMITKSQLTD